MEGFGLITKKTRKMKCIIALLVLAVAFVSAGFSSPRVSSQNLSARQMSKAFCFVLRLTELSGIDLEMFVIMILLMFILMCILFYRRIVANCSLLLARSTLIPPPHGPLPSTLAS